MTILLNLTGPTMQISARTNFHIANRVHEVATQFRLCVAMTATQLFWDNSNPADKLARSCDQQVHEKLGRPVSLLTIIKSRKPKLFGHVTRMDEGWLLMMVTFGMVEGRRPRGRPSRRWVDDITDGCQVDMCAVTAMAQDRNLWKEFTTSPDGQLAMG